MYNANLSKYKKVRAISNFVNEVIVDFAHVLTRWSLHVISRGSDSMWHIDARIDAERGVVGSIQALRTLASGIRSANKFTFASCLISLARLFAPEDESKDGRCDKN